MYSAVTVNSKLDNFFLKKSFVGTSVCPPFHVSGCVVSYYLKNQGIYKLRLDIGHPCHDQLTGAIMGYLLNSVMTASQVHLHNSLRRRVLLKVFANRLWFQEIACSEHLTLERQFLKVLGRASLSGLR